MIEFNINEYVLVKLTKAGIDELERQHEELRLRLPKLSSKLPNRKEDEEGFTRWQLWSLMNTFGHMVGLGMEPPFDTNIKLAK